MENIILIGMPAAGKSTIGKLLAEKMDYRFIDTDTLIEDGEKRSLCDVIERSGLTEFKKIEESYVLKVEGTNQIIATGGSVIYGDKAMAHLSEKGTIIFLELDLPSLQKRIKSLSKRGVVIEEGKSFDELFEERNGLYSKYADITINCRSRSPRKIYEEIIHRIS